MVTYLKMTEIFQQLYQQQYLSRAQARDTLLAITQGKYAAVEVAAFLSIFNMRSISIDELKGFRDALLSVCRPLDLSAYNAIDVCGTGGDGKHTFNISTLSAFVIAGSGVPVVKHGNYGVSSVSGSSNVMECLGVSFQQSEEGLKRQLDAANVCFIHAPYFNPGMKAVAAIRKQLGFKTFFNMLGPLINPAQPRYQLVGLYDPGLMRMYQYLFQDEGRQFSLVHSVDGYDEVSLTADFKCFRNSGEHYYSIRELGTPLIKASDLYGGNSVAEAAAIFMNILKGKGTVAQNEVVIINSAFAIQTVEPGLDLEAAKSIARLSLEGGHALYQFNQLKKIL